MTEAADQRSSWSDPGRGVSKPTPIEKLEPYRSKPNVDVPTQPRLRRKILVGRLIQAAWRRRFLVIVPLLLMVPLSVAAALILPRTYVAHTLLLLQEGERNNPLAHDTPASSALQQRVAGLDALLKSEQVLRPVVDNGTGANSPQMIAKIEDLRRALSLNLIGSDFLQIELRGSTATGLGLQLQRILSRFFEVLLTENTPNAGQIVGLRRGQDLKSAEATHEALEKQLTAVLPDGLANSTEQLQKLQAESSGKVGGDATAVEAQIAQLKNKIMDYARIQARLDESKQTLASLRASYQNYVNRYGNAGSEAGVGVLGAPGRIKVIDPPADPISATVSRLRFVIGGLIGALLIGVGLAWGAEVLDSTIRYPEQLTAATRSPILSRLPKVFKNLRSPAPHSETVPDSELSPALRVPMSARRVAAFFVTALIVGLAFGLMADLPLQANMSALRHWMAARF
jgi:uncharacterized protein involved in exopolysaccharide biosynthesis